MLKIVTGKTGEPHVTSSDDRHRNAGIFGKGMYVLDTGNRLEARKTESNTIKISNGDLMINGTHARIAPNEDENVTIEGGTSGVNRRDMIVAEYRKTNGIESVTIEVIKGTETTGTPTTPEYKTGDILNGSNIVDMPLYTVDLIGVDVQEPHRLFEIKKPMSEVFDLIYPVGSIYINTNDVNPAVLFGGTWERFAQGRTLVSIGSVRDDAGNVKTFEEGERGGEITHKLTTSELPAHSHNVKVDKLTTSAGRASHLAVSPIMGDYSNFAADSVGSDVAHNNMQPYVAVYIWKRLS